MLVVVVVKAWELDHAPAGLVRKAGGSSTPLPKQAAMLFKLTPKHDGKPMNYSEELNGTRTDAYNRACEIALALHKLLKRATFTVRVERTDRPGQPYEVRHDGHTI